MRTSEPGNQRYLIALGSNMRHYRHGDPRKVLRAALAALADEGVLIESTAPIHTSAPLGPSRRRYANGAALLRSWLGPPQLLALLKTLERRFGRRRGSQRWAARVLDLDIVLWSGGCWASRDLRIPHPAFRGRAFMLAPANRIAPHWRDPITGRSLRHLNARLTAPRPLPRAGVGGAGP